MIGNAQQRREPEKEHLMCKNGYFTKYHPIAIRPVHVEALEGKAGNEGVLRCSRRAPRSRAPHAWAVADRTMYNIYLYVGPTHQTCTKRGMVFVQSGDVIVSLRHFSFISPYAISIEGRRIHGL